MKVGDRVRFVNFSGYTSPPRNIKDCRGIIAEANPAGYCKVYLRYKDYKTPIPAFDRDYAYAFYTESLVPDVWEQEDLD